MSKKWLLRLLRSSSSLLGLITIALASGAILVQQREYQQDIAAHDFLRQAAQTGRNDAARQLDEKLQQLGLGRTDGNRRNKSTSDDTRSHFSPDGEAQSDAKLIVFNDIEPSLSQFLEERRSHTVEQASLGTLPPTVSEYLLQQPKIAEIQRLILENPLPTWELQIPNLIRNPNQTQMPRFFPIANLQRLLLAQGLHSYHQSPKASAESFEAAWRLTEAIAARPDLLSKMFAGILQQQQMTLLRHVDLPDGQQRWQQRLKQDQQQAMSQALTFDRWAEYQALQHQQEHQHRLHASAREGRKPWQNLVGRTYLQFSRLDWLAARRRNQTELMRQPLCDADTSAAQFPVRPHRLNSFGQGNIVVFAQEWIKASDRMLAAELTQKVMQAKQIARTEGQWPQQLPQLTSRVCPQVAWNYERQADGGIRLWFDQPAHWRIGMSGDFAPLSYEAGAYQYANQADVSTTVSADS